MQAGRRRGTVGRQGQSPRQSGRREDGTRDDDHPQGGAVVTPRAGDPGAGGAVAFVTSVRARAIRRVVAVHFTVRVHRAVTRAVIALVGCDPGEGSANQHGDHEKRHRTE